MKRLLLVAALLSCRGRGSVPDAALDLDARALTAHRVAGTWTRDGVEWRAIVIGNVPRAELKRLAHALHAENPACFLRYLR